MNVPTKKKTKYVSINQMHTNVDVNPPCTDHCTLYLESVPTFHMLDKVPIADL